MNIKLFASAAVSALMIAGSATAASLSFSGDTDTAILPGGPTGFSAGDLGATGLSVGDTITTVGKDIGVGGLSVDADNVTFEVTYLGSEAGHLNEAVELAMGDTLFINKGPDAASIGDTATFKGGLAGFVAFLFRDLTDGGEFVQNGETGASATGLRIGFSEISSDGKSVVALFADGLGDGDFDDLAIRISIVPLPAGGLLLLTALGGIGVMRRKKS
ncbi:VPLPA-CTERM sorting domain-containing protein [Roseovarius sp. EL26]|uniref:VPLPA-CTERM sorting domain-containing protein n=1 Tax=Roseovarius sp. EL26 TaxID=2126672 RepID=UPI0013C4C72D|nr:VPLPA-CTERM sorting domain-containing protein [Roseovarius sp. EL26]